MKGSDRRINKEMGQAEKAVKVRKVIRVRHTAEGTEWLASPPMAPKSYDWKCSQRGEGPTPLLLLEI